MPCGLFVLGLVLVLEKNAEIEDESDDEDDTRNLSFRYVFSSTGSETEPRAD